jgi:HK97 family phage prohead protease
MPPRRFKVSDESINSKGYWVVTKGIEIPLSGTVPLFYDHEVEGKLALGKWKNFNVESDGSLTAEVEFDEKDSFAVELKRKVDDGFITTCSMGFLIKESSKEKQFLKAGQIRPTVKKSRLVEISLCAIPSNENAVKLSAEQTEDVMLPIIELKEENNMQNLRELLSQKGFSLKDLNLADDATDEQIIAAIQKLAAPQAPEGGVLTVAEKLVDSVLKYGKLTGIVTEQNETYFKKLALADSDATIQLIENLAKERLAAQKNIEKNATVPPVTTTKLSDLATELLKQTQTSTTEKVVERKPKEIGFDARVHKAVNKQ